MTPLIGPPITSGRAKLAIEPRVPANCRAPVYIACSPASADRWIIAGELGSIGVASPTGGVSKSSSKWELGASAVATGVTLSAGKSSLISAIINLEALCRLLYYDARDSHLYYGPLSRELLGLNFPNSHSEQHLRLWEVFLKD